jgi:hypothetical protein
MTKPKHPKDMTSKELAKRLFHPDVIKHAKKVVASSAKKATKRK